MKKLNEDLLSLHKCEDCGYIGNVGFWVGTATVDEEEREYSGLVYSNPNDDGMFDLDNLLEEHELEECEEFDGEANCPICKSENFWPIG